METQVIDNRLLNLKKLYELREMVNEISKTENEMDSLINLFKDALDENKAKFEAIQDFKTNEVKRQKVQTYRELVDTVKSSKLKKYILCYYLKTINDYGEHISRIIEVMDALSFSMFMSIAIRYNVEFKNNDYDFKLFKALYERCLGHSKGTYSDNHNEISANIEKFTISYEKWHFSIHAVARDSEYDYLFRKILSSIHENIDKEKVKRFLEINSPSSIEKAENDTKKHYKGMKNIAFENYDKEKKRLKEKFEGAWFKTSSKKEQYIEKIKKLDMECQEKIQQIDIELSQKINEMRNSNRVETKLIENYLYQQDWDMSGISQFSSKLFNEVISMDNEYSRLNNIYTEADQIDNISYSISNIESDIKEFECKREELNIHKREIEKLYISLIPPKYILNFDAVNYFIQYIFYEQATKIGECISLYENRELQEDIIRASLSVKDSVDSLKDSIGEQLSLVNMQLWTINSNLESIDNKMSTVIDNQLTNNSMLDEVSNLLTDTNSSLEINNRQQKHMIDNQAASINLQIQSNKGINKLEQTISEADRKTHKVGHELVTFTKDCNDFMRKVKTEKFREGKYYYI